MKSLTTWGLPAIAALLLAACGGGGDGDQSVRVQYSSLVSFGDSLSDVGTYATPALKGATGGGEYSINGATGVNWTELLAPAAGVAAPCAAVTGLNASGPLVGFAQVETAHAGCYDYAQGGARITNPVGPANAALLGLGNTTGYLGQLTVPVVTQIQRHLAAVGGSFSGTELVTLLAGGNDALMNLAAVGAGQESPTQAVTAMGTAGAELAGYIKTLIVANGAKHVVVLNLPDLSQTPLAFALPVSTQGLINTMVTTFNAQLAAGLQGTPEVLLIDLYTQVRAQMASPTQYGVTNNTDRACDLTKTLLPSSLACSATTLIAGDVSHYAFADDVHPTPYGYKLIAQYVIQQMALAGWL